MQENNKRNWFEEICYTIRYCSAHKHNVRNTEAKNTKKIIIEHNQNKSSIFSTIKNIPLVAWVIEWFKS